jgi:hypothetical protein
MWTGAWPSQALTNVETRLKELARLVERPPSGQGEDISAAMARFLVIRACGYLEQTVEECCRAYLTSKSAPTAASFGRSWLGRGGNPWPGSLVQLVRRFDGSWGDELQALFDRDDEQLKREVSLLVDRRNKIAHGLSEGIGARKALDLVAATEPIADWFIWRLDPR